MTAKKLMDLIILCGILLLIGLTVENARAATVYGPYTLEGPVAVDGDTISADVLIWPNIMASPLIRVSGIDTPEIKAATQCERDKAMAARNFTDKWLLDNAPVIASQVRNDKFAGRVDAIITGKTGSLAAALLAAGHARPYNGGPRLPWCQ